MIDLYTNDWKVSLVNKPTTGPHPSIAKLCEIASKVAPPDYPPSGIYCCSAVLWSAGQHSEHRPAFLMRASVLTATELCGLKVGLPHSSTLTLTAIFLHNILQL
jgi:hypothetical protein